ncbi:dihydrofolate reductase family protein [Catellatospora chokoriensis]|uniref:Deaminase reductase n=1 Tax=Catellatospora chokoriensis TaxID=310353 RepID=A0A8J3JQM4_9ACTN|nr:dihydrofolate reductase family protein [Catellatospora chokoriensis]GIF89312.1 deaminase reductase [Catellatospora chokoriensis]
MRLTLTEFVTLDGVYQGPGGPAEDTTDGFVHGGWVVPFFDDVLGGYITGVFGEVDAFLLGRRTYDIFAEAWPRSTDPADPIAAALNTLPKYVASGTLTAADWHRSTVLGGDVVAEVAKLKEQSGRELQIHGSGALAQTLFDAGLIDLVRLIVFPVVLGSGKRLFAEGRTPSRFRLADVTSTPTGVTMQTLELAGVPEYGSMEVE